MAASFTGALIHVSLDSIIYTDVTPFLLFEFNPFLPILSVETVYSTCISSFLMGGAYYLYFVRRK